MLTNPLNSKVETEVEKLLLRAREGLLEVPSRLQPSVQDIIDTLENYLHSDDGHWPEYRKSVPGDFVIQEFSSRLNLWKENKIISFQNDDAPNLTMAERAMATLADGGFTSNVIEGDVGIHVSKSADRAIKYLDSHFLAHPYSAIKGSDDSVVFTILDSRYYPAEAYDKTLQGTLILSIEDLRNRIINFSTENEAYANHLETVIGGE
jgi:hypothetical protein